MARHRKRIVAKDEIRFIVRHTLSWKYLKCVTKPCLASSGLTINNRDINIPTASYLCLYCLQIRIGRKEDLDKC